MGLDARSNLSIQLQCRLCILQGKHRAAPPPAFGSQNAQSGQAPRAPKDGPMTPQKEGADTSPSTALGSTPGPAPSGGQPLSHEGPDVIMPGTASKPAPKADISTSSAGPQGLPSATKSDVGLSKQAGDAGHSQAPAQPLPGPPQPSSAQAAQTGAASSTTAAAAKPGHSTSPLSDGPAPPQPVKAHAQPSATLPEAVRAASPASAAVGAAQTPAAKAEAASSPSAASTATAASTGPARSKAQQHYYTGGPQLKHWQCHATFHMSPLKASVCCTLRRWSASIPAGAFMLSGM